MRRYHIQGRDDYTAYNRAAGLATKLTALLARLPASDATRIDVTDALLDRLYDAGVIPVKNSLAVVEKLSTASFARRRLAVVMVRLRMAETVKEAATFVEQGHVRVGPTTVTDPAFHVARADEDYVTWVGASAVRRKVAKYNDALDDYDLLAAS
jgi:U3 small nucleolar ribonucleoprotein protein IMP3